MHVPQTATVIEQLEQIEVEKDRVNLNAVTKLISEIDTVKREAK